MELFVFNPEHDYALADGSPNYVAMRSAMQFSYDCAPFLQYLVSPDDIVYNLYDVANQEFVNNRKPFPDPVNINKVNPWGWDAAVKRQLLNAGAPATSMPDDSQICKIRQIAHRNLSVKALRYLRKRAHQNDLFPLPAVECRSADEIVGFVNENVHALFKSPYSGNGRGHLFAHNACTPTMMRCAMGVIKKQGSILAEKNRNILKEFAMEFQISGSEVSFAGYSMFETFRYAYSKNFLLPDEEIESELYGYLPQGCLDDVKSLISEFLVSEVAPCYDGNVGVDMYIFEEDGACKLQPVSEINLRMTMGAAAHKIYNTLCHSESRGYFNVLRYDGKGELLQYVEEQNKKNPLTLKDGKWRSGFKSLNPITVNTMYAVCVTLF